MVVSSYPNSLKNIKKNPSQSERGEDAPASFTEKKGRNHLEFILCCCGPGGVNVGNIHVRIACLLSLSAERRIYKGV
jgi:hypothetical protein